MHEGRARRGHHDLYHGRRGHHGHHGHHGHRLKTLKLG